jgi:DNA-nicking Smr family endonuclease
MTNDDNSLSDDDLMVWHYVLQNVEPLPGKERPIYKKSEEHSDFTDQPQEKIDLSALLEKQNPHSPRKIQLDYITHNQNVGVDKATAKRLTGGKFPIEARLDLHGKTQNAALESLRNFISASYESGKRNVLIITGKGPSNDGILKQQVPRWLNVEGIREYTLMFSYAQARHGGDGALYVLLKKRR